MLHKYYTIPIKCKVLIEKNNLEKCGLDESIRQHIHLILRTHFKEYRFDQAYGNVVWEKDFETIRSIPKWKNELSEDFGSALKKYEKRLSDLWVTTDLDELKIVDPQTQKLTELRKRITIRINGTINKTNQPFQHIEHIFFSPLSLI